MNGLRDALAEALFDYRTSSNVPLPPDWFARQSEVMQQPVWDEADAILAHPAMVAAVAALRATDVPSDGLRQAAQRFLDASELVSTLTIDDGPAYEDGCAAYLHAKDALTAAPIEKRWRDASRTLHASGDDEPFDYDTPRPWSEEPEKGEGLG